jgi:FkbM family methyltransferase
MNNDSIKNQRLWDWNRIKNYKQTDRTHHSEILEIINVIDFDCFIDCGVGNVGSEAWSVRDLKPNCVIIGFEPQNERYEILKSNLYPGNLLKLVVGKNCEEIEGYMGYEDGGKSDFWLYGGDAENNNAYKKVKLNSVTIDKIVDEYNLLNKKIFIWADIEGSELDMLYGAQKTLENNLITGLNMELRDYREAPNHCLAQEVIDLLLKYNIVSSTSRKIEGTHKDFLFKLI